MGSSPSEEGRDDDEHRHRVTVETFELMTTEVTQGMWEEVMGQDIRYLRDEANPDWSLRGAGSSYPVYYVSWNDCQEFIDRLNDMDPSHTYRLPTEAEWEYACRAGTTTRFYWGESDSESTMKRYCWYDKNADESDDGVTVWTFPHATKQGTQPVGDKTPNAWGLYDMSGNAWEWCQDIYTRDYDDCPTDGSAYTGSGSNRVIRGGGWDRNAWYCRSAYRNNDSPGLRRSYLGFRVARSVS